MQGSETYYWYNRTFASAGIYSYNITCHKEGLAILSAIDNITVTAESVPATPTTPAGTTSTANEGAGAGTYTSFDISEEILKVQLYQGQTVLQQFKISNSGTETMDFTIQNPDYKHMALSETSFTLAPGGEKVINVAFTAKETDKADIYTGKLIVKADGITKPIIVIWEIKEKTSLFDIKSVLNENQQSRMPGQDIESTIYLYNFGKLKPVDVELFYSIRDFNGNDIIQQHETFAVEEQKEFNAILPIPNDLPEGYYLFYAKANHPYGNVSTSAVFRVSKVGPILESPSQLLGTLAFILIILLFLVGGAYIFENHLSRLIVSRRHKANQAYDDMFKHIAKWKHKGYDTEILEAPIMHERIIRHKKSIFQGLSTRAKESLYNQYQGLSALGANVGGLFKNKFKAKKQYTKLQKMQPKVSAVSVKLGHLNDFFRHHKSALDSYILEAIEKGKTKAQIISKFKPEFPDVTKHYSKLSKSYRQYQKAVSEYHSLHVQSVSKQYEHYLDRLSKISMPKYTIPSIKLPEYQLPDYKLASKIKAQFTELQKLMLNEVKLKESVKVVKEHKLLVKPELLKTKAVTKLKLEHPAKAKNVLEHITKVKNVIATKPVEHKVRSDADTANLLQKIKLWKSKGYDTSILEAELKSPVHKTIVKEHQIAKIMEWKAKGYDTRLLEAELNAKTLEKLKLIEKIALWKSKGYDTRVLEKELEK